MTRVLMSFRVCTSSTLWKPGTNQIERGYWKDKHYKKKSVVVVQRERTGCAWQLGTHGWHRWGLLSASASSKSPATLGLSCARQFSCAHTNWSVRNAQTNGLQTSVKYRTYTWVWSFHAYTGLVSIQKNFFRMLSGLKRFLGVIQTVDWKVHT